MDLSPNPDQESFVAATAEWCRDNLPLDQARARPANLWRDLEAMGWLGMTAPEMGLDHATEALVFAELGRFLAPVGMISTAVAARWTRTPSKTALALQSSPSSLGEGDHAQHSGGVSQPVEHPSTTLRVVPLPEQSSGRSIRIFDPQDSALALGVIGGQVATAVLPQELGAEPGLDLSAPMTLLQSAIFTPLSDPRAALHLQLLAAAFAIGCADAACDMAADYAKVREQFERPIGWFQALKHLCSDMAVRCAVARSQLYYAACALDAAAPDAAFHIAAAKRLADQAALDNGRANIQVHGGIGMTDEAAPHLCLKRAHLLGFVAPATTADLLGVAA